jgi:hypothetical protein
MAKRRATYYPSRINLAVRNKAYVSHIEGPGIVYASLGTPNATGAALATTQSNDTTVAGVAAAVNGTLDQTSVAVMGVYGRGLSIVASAAATNVVQIRGRDFLGQFMREDLTLNGTTAVLGVKAFRYVDSITPVTGTSSTTVTLTLVNLFGLPHKFQSIDQELKNSIVAANAGTFVAGLATATAATATNADVRGTYLPVTVLPDGVIPLVLRYFADETNLDGNAQFFA